MVVWKVWVRDMINNGLEVRVFGGERSVVFWEYFLGFKWIIGLLDVEG